MAEDIPILWELIMEDIHENGPSGSFRISERLEYAQGTITKSLGDMVKRGYVARERFGNYLYYSLTEKAKAAFKFSELPSWLDDDGEDDEDADGFWVPTDALAVMCDTARHVEAVAIAQWLTNTANELEDRGSADDEREAIILRRKAQEIQERAPFVRGINSSKLN